MGMIGNAPAAGVIRSGDILDGTVDTVDLKDGAVTTAKITDANVTNAKLGSDLDASKLTAGTLPIARVADGAVTAAKLASTAVTDKLGYTPARTSDLWVTTSGDTARYYQIALLDQNNGNCRVKGTLGGHDGPEGGTQGVMSLDLTIYSRYATLVVQGSLTGNCGVQDLLIYKDVANNKYIYVKTVNYSLDDLTYSGGGGSTIYSNPSYSTTAPTGTLLWSASANQQATQTPNKTGTVMLGAVTTPQRPAFRVRGPSPAQNVTALNVIPFNQPDYNVGSGFASNVFTAPVSGKYFFSMLCFARPSLFGFAGFRVNGAVVDRMEFYGANSTYNQHTVVMHRALSYGDTVDCYCSSGEVHVNGDAAPASNFSGFLIG